VGALPVFRDSTLFGLVCVLPILAAAAPVEAGRGDIAPFDLGVQVEFAEGVGSDDVHREVRREMVRGLDKARCYRSVRSSAPEGDGDDLLMRVSILSVEDELQHEVSMAERNAPDAPREIEQMKVSSFRIRLLMELMVADHELLLRSKRHEILGSYRPIRGEDPRFEARRAAIADVVRISTGFACKGSPKKLARQIEESRAGAR